MIPNNIFLEPTSICNLNCIFCCNNIRKDKGTMSNDEFKRICKKICKYGIPKIDISPLTGEIFSDNQILEKMEILEKSNIKEWCFFTNLTLMNKDIIKELSKFKRLSSISLSINGENRKSFNFLTKGNFNLYDNVVENLEYLFNYRFHLEVYMKLIDINFYDHWAKSNILRVIFKNKNKICYLTQQFELDDWISNISTRKIGKYLKIENSFENDRICRTLNNKNVIRWNGNFHLCGCRDIGKNTFVGNIKEKSLEDLYNDDKIKLIKNNWKETCKNCGHFR